MSSADKQYENMTAPVSGLGGTRASTANSASRERYLLPEFVSVHRVRGPGKRVEICSCSLSYFDFQMPASLWQECQLLPFVLDHLSRLLQVSAFQARYVRFSNDYPKDWVVAQDHGKTKEVRLSWCTKIDSS